jgi:hypothetical protein
VGLTTPHRKKQIRYDKLHKDLGPGRILWMNDPSEGIPFRDRSQCCGLELVWLRIGTGGELL